MAEEHTTEYIDAEGNPHPYKATKLPFTRSLPLFLQISEVAGGTIGGGIGAALSLNVPTLSAISFDGLGDALAQLPARLYAHNGGVGLLVKLLATTRRGEYLPDGEIVWSPPLTKPGHLDAAFGSDLLEAFHVVSWALEVNYRPFLTGLSRKWGAPLQKLRAMLPIVPIAPQASPSPTPDKPESTG